MRILIVAILCSALTGCTAGIRAGGDRGVGVGASIGPSYIAPPPSYLPPPEPWDR